MDVRCESCHTEYELDDASVSDAGTDVQCTFCGHTFTVFRRAAVAAPGPGPSGGESVLETADGRVHRLRDLTVLQKWIIERRVTRSDRLSRDGQNWTRLGALEDLAPFFDVVDEADRARASQSRSSSPDIAAARAQGARPAAAAPVAAGGTVLGHSSPSLPIMPTVTPRGGQKPVTAAGGEPARPRGGERATNRSLELMAVEAPFGATDPETSLVRRPSRGWWKLFVTFGVAGGVAYAGIRALPGMMTPPASSSAAQTGPSSSAVVEPIGQAPAPLPPGDPSAAPGTTAPPTPTEAPAAAAPATEPASPPAAPPPAPAAAQPAVARTEPAAAPTPPAEAPPAAKPAERAPRPRPAAPPEAPTYESLVAQADKLLGNGANERAMRLYERALAIKPGAPDALTGIGYAHLDRSRTGPAIDYFTRASSGSPHAPALFGLGQAYRAAGDFNRARETYRRYLSLFPNGPESSAAERQLRSMPSGAAEPAGGGGGEVSAPASILQEGGAQEPAKPREGGGGSAPASPPRPLDSPTP